LFGEAFAVSDIEAPTVEVAFDDVAVNSRIGQRVAFVRTEIFDGVVFSADVEEGDLVAVLELDGRAAAFRQRADLADLDLFPLAVRFAFVDVVFTHNSIWDFGFGISDLLKPASSDFFMYLILFKFHNLKSKIQNPFALLFYLKQTIIKNKS
jgi:hypothetical protein